MTKTLSAGVTVGANLTPLALVFLGKASTGSLVLLYWGETLVIGFYELLRLAIARGTPPILRSVAIILFALVFGLFSLWYGYFITGFAPFQDREGRAAIMLDWPFPFWILQQVWGGCSAMGLFSPQRLLFPLFALFASHGVSFLQKQVLGGRYLTAQIGDIGGRVFGPLFVLHIAIVLGAILVGMLGSSLPMLGLLIIGKTVLELALYHRRQNR